MSDLDLPRIARAALKVADEHGVEGFTMRAVAELLSVTPMALYHHVADKKALVALVVDAVIRELPLPAPTGAWQDDLWEMARWMRTTIRVHPAVGALRRAYRVWTPAMLPMSERWLSVWQQSGLDLKRAQLAATTSSLAIIGAAEEEMLASRLDVPDAASLDQFPNARSLLTARDDPDERFELLVRSVIDGVHRRLRESSHTVMVDEG